MDYFELHVAGLTRQLPICKVNDEISFAAFVMFGDVELTERVAEELLKKCPEFDVIVTAEAKGIPLAYAMARMSGKTYIPARKAPKLYMHDPIAIEVKSISTAVKQTLWLDQGDIDKINGARILTVGRLDGNILNFLRSICKRWEYLYSIFHLGSIIMGENTWKGYLHSLWN